MPLQAQAHFPFRFYWLPLLFRIDLLLLGFTCSYLFLYFLKSCYSDLVEPNLSLDRDVFGDHDEDAI
jgi:hypothetical protein